MPHVIAPRPGLWKPPAGSTLDFQHPLTRGMLAGIFALEGAGSATQDLVTRQLSVPSLPVAWGLDRPATRTTPPFNPHPAPTLRLTTSTNIEFAHHPRYRQYGPQFTAAWWAAIDTLGSSQRVFSNWNGSQGFILFYNSNWIFWLNTSVSGTVNATGSDFKTSGSMHHVVGTYDGVTQIIYVDGVRSGSRATSGLVSSSTNPLWIGRSESGGEKFNGNVAAAMMWDRAMSPDEVRWLYAEPYGMLRGPEIARRYWVLRGAPQDVVVTPDPVAVPIALPAPAVTFGSGSAGGQIIHSG